MKAEEHYKKMAGLIEQMIERWQDPLSLNDLASSCDLSPYYFQRLFKQWVGVSPKVFEQQITLSQIKPLLHSQRSLLDTTYESGLSSPARLHDLFVRFEAMTPGQYKQKGANVKISFASFPSPLGAMTIARTNFGICDISFGLSVADAAANLQERWPLSTLQEDSEALRETADQVNQSLAKGSSEPLHLHLKGTPFQVKVWQALLKIPSGMVVSYQDLAENAGEPRAIRAVASAVGRNPVAFLVPCHRVIRQSGILGQYRWHPARKACLLNIESRRANANSDTEG